MGKWRIFKALKLTPFAPLILSKFSHSLMPVDRGGAKGAYAPPPFVRGACRRASTQPARACAHEIATHYFSLRNRQVQYVRVNGVMPGRPQRSASKVGLNLTLCSPEYYHHCHYVYNHPLRSFKTYNAANA